jgi:hypothetical protein
MQNFDRSIEFSLRHSFTIDQDAAGLFITESDVWTAIEESTESSKISNCEPGSNNVIYDRPFFLTNTLRERQDDHKNKGFIPARLKNFFKSIVMVELDELT